MLVCPTCRREHARLSSKPGARGPRTFFGSHVRTQDIHCVEYVCVVLSRKFLINY